MNAIFVLCHNTDYLLTESEVMPGNIKLRPQFDISRHDRTVEVIKLLRNSVSPAEALERAICGRHDYALANQNVHTIVAI